MLKYVLWIGIAIGALSGCVDSGNTLVFSDETPTLHPGDRPGYAPLDAALEQMMRVRATGGDASEPSAGGLVLDPDLSDGAGMSCQRDEEGHAVCCERRDASWCCVHAGPTGDTQVCL